MPAQFQIHALDPALFTELFSLDDRALEQRGARRIKVEAFPGSPCRITLEDTPVGEPVILLEYAHHRTDSPYRASGPIFIRETTRQARPRPGEIPAMLTRRPQSLRAYDGAGTMVAARLSDGSDLAEQLTTLLADPAVSYVHLHNAGAGCFNCCAQRVRSDRAA